MKIQVAAAILKDDSLTLITTSGEYHKIPQGDARIRPLLDLVLPIVKNGGTVEVDLASVTQNHYEEFEKKTNGVIRFFRVAKEKLKSWFGEKSLTVDGTYGNIPDTPKAEEEEKLHTLPEVQTEEVLAAQRERTLKEITESATPIAGMVFNEGTKQNDVPLQENETVIAVVDGKGIVPNAQNLLPQIARSNKIGSTIGMENFMRRTAGLKRQHSQEDLIQFIGKSDLQVADDGCILGWKNLNSSGEENVYVDPFTRKVRQWIGSLVFMAENLVDPNRGQDCSNGLHVASRSYLGGYMGNGGGTFLIKIRPEDVIAVPKYNTNKMRVCAYHILGKLSPEDTRLMLDNKPLASEAGQRLLAHAVAGTHIAVTHKTEITGSRGEGCIYTTVDAFATPATNEDTVAVAVEDETVAVVEPVDYENAEAAPVIDPNEVAEEVTELKSGQPTRKEQAEALYEAWAASGAKLDSQEFHDLTAFKKACKVSWSKLGLPSSPNGNVLPPTASVALPPVEAPVQAVEAVEEAPAPVVAEEAELSAEELYERYIDSDADSAEERKYAGLLLKVLDSDPDAFYDVCDSEDVQIFRDIVEEDEQPTPTEEKTVEAPKKLTPSGEKKPYREQLQDLLKGETSLTLKSPSKARSALSIKQASKKGWSVLGVDEKLAKRIVELAK
ncbi:RIIB lysis inhibitor [Stenotrophomonas phage Philippe]|uniref:RIIb-like protein n=1 Tax=Stenotrophomonas phage Philippe TaxID=2859655 RepID=A0AAE7WML1_9CAUD|nr:RIIB lysis inhibitor [Stenotrophomonas phage Philippe]QYW02256.1 rIIb-like protein [Stenotrophomonas phage Philippe]